ncbi:MAG: hypothetical protein F4Y12_03820 [Acidimicrobiaceae bacterium]|nr:hypothetical protein [Acidimicrobiaceae bacterium]MYH78639.1 hypothetical protein [Acidimicrobiaceae bacterium]MYK66516.1 hypothetical protein [Gemmatimonadota bacterium]
MTSAETTEVVERSAWPVFITVNRKEVKVDGPKVSGLDIKKAAIEQGLEIKLDFKLAEETADGKERIIGDADIVEVTEKSVFWATAGDDNS